MKTIIAGSRSITDMAMLDAALVAWGWKDLITAVVCGEARGADALGKAWAECHGLPVLSFPAAWAQHGKAAGPIRNQEMADAADALLALWDGRSKGTENMIAIARRKHQERRKAGDSFPVYVYTQEDYARYQKACGWTKANARVPEHKRTPYDYR